MKVLDEYLKKRLKNFKNNILKKKALDNRKIIN